MNLDNVKDMLLGAAVGDALGVPVEFMSRSEVRKLDIRYMMGCDVPYVFASRWTALIPSGCWSDDTSMAVATMESVIRRKGIIDYEDIMRSFIEWWYEGDFCSYDFAFGIGKTVECAMKRYLETGCEAVLAGGDGFRDNGNGSLMRIFPISLYCLSHAFSYEETVRIIGEASALTHRNPISRMSCQYYTNFVRACMGGADPGAALEAARGAIYDQFYPHEALEQHRRLLSPDFHEYTENQISSYGYVIDTLETAIYSVLHSRDYEGAVLTAVNMGGDTDTSACVTGSIAGLIYGRGSIPARWLNHLRRRDYLEKLAERYFAAVTSADLLNTRSNTDWESVLT